MIMLGLKLSDVSKMGHMKQTGLTGSYDGWRKLQNIFSCWRRGGVTNGVLNYVLGNFAPWVYLEKG